MSKDDQINAYGNAMRVQKHQVSHAESQVGKIDTTLDDLIADQQRVGAALDDAISHAERVLEQNHIEFFIEEEDEYLVEVESYQEVLLNPGSRKVPIAELDYIKAESLSDWNHYVDQVERYAAMNNLNLQDDPFKNLMSDSQRIALEKRILDEFSYKNASCDKYDYMIAATCGLIGGLIDIIFVVAPGKGALGKVTDNATDKFVEKFATNFGWTGTTGDNPTKSAIGYLENGRAVNSDFFLFDILNSLGFIDERNGQYYFKGFKVNYDQATTNGKNGTDGIVENLSASNHHLKSMGHSPDLIGLIISIINQFTSTSTFLSNGKVITIDTETHELHGSNFISKIFSGFVNWLGHLISDMAGSSGASGRGAGIPIPFYNLLLLIDAGSFGKDRQSFAVVATKVFEQGYDFRHGIAMAIPVLITEVLTRLMWAVKQRLYHNRPWRECIPSTSNPELRRMLLVAHGSLCLVDTVDATLRSGGNLIGFMLHSNMIAWARFGTLALKELKACYQAGSLDHDVINKHLDDELQRMLT